MTVQLAKKLKLCPDVALHINRFLLKPREHYELVHGTPYRPQVMLFFHVCIERFHDWIFYTQPFWQRHRLPFKLNAKHVVPGYMRDLLKKRDIGAILPRDFKVLLAKERLIGNLKCVLKYQEKMDWDNWCLLDWLAEY